MPFKQLHPLYSVWQGMLRRCKTPTNPAFAYYGGRGISVCERWSSFKNFVDDMGERPAGHSLDRRDNDGDYTPENCRWATRTQQQRNQTVTRRVQIGNKLFIAAELAEFSGLKTDTIITRAKAGLSMIDILRPQRRVFADGLKLGGRANGARRRALTHCLNGHEFTEKNTSITPEGWRRCLHCHRDRQNSRRERMHP